jgi:hypothetical protein
MCIVTDVRRINDELEKELEKKSKNKVATIGTIKKIHVQMS